ncbi:hypothetical protein L249_5329, partial [Ophiocordyceps polyrhachis-furcata BCC 54312]
TRCKDIRTFSRKKGEFSAFLTNLKDKIRTDKATFRDEEDRIGFLFRSLEGKARKTLETRLLTKTKDNSLSYEDFYGYIKDSYPARNFKNAPVALQEYYNRYLAAAAADKLYNDDNDDNCVTLTAAAPRVRRYPP